MSTVSLSVQHEGGQVILLSCVFQYSSCLLSSPSSEYLATQGSWCLIVGWWTSGETKSICWASMQEQRAMVGWWIPGVTESICCTSMQKGRALLQSSGISSALAWSRWMPCLLIQSQWNANTWLLLSVGKFSQLRFAHQATFGFNSTRASSIVDALFCPVHNVLSLHQDGSVWNFVLQT